MRLEAIYQRTLSIGRYFARGHGTASFKCNYFNWKNRQKIKIIFLCRWMLFFTIISYYFVASLVLFFFDRLKEAHEAFIVRLLNFNQRKMFFEREYSENERVNKHNKK